MKPMQEIPQDSIVHVQAHCTICAGSNTWQFYVSVKSFHKTD